MTDRVTKRGHLLPLAMAATLLLGMASLADAQTTSLAPTAAEANGGLQQSHNAWRSTKLAGATVYNEQGDSVGIIDDMLLDSAGHVSNVAPAVGGFPGVDAKYIEVPFSKLKFEPSKRDTSNHDYSIVLPGVTKDSFKAMTAFSY